MPDFKEEYNLEFEGMIGGTTGITESGVIKLPIKLPNYELETSVELNMLFNCNLEIYAKHPQLEEEILLGTFLINGNRCDDNGTYIWNFNSSIQSLDTKNVTDLQSVNTKGDIIKFRIYYKFNETSMPKEEQDDNGTESVDAWDNIPKQVDPWEQVDDTQDPWNNDVWGNTEKED